MLLICQRSASLICKLRVVSPTIRSFRVSLAVIFADSSRTTSKTDSSYRKWSYVRKCYPSFRSMCTTCIPGIVKSVRILSALFFLLLPKQTIHIRFWYFLCNKKDMLTCTYTSCLRWNFGSRVPYRYVFLDLCQLDMRDSSTWRASSLINIFIPSVFFVYILSHLARF